MNNMSCKSSQEEMRHTGKIYVPDLKIVLPNIPSDKKCRQSCNSIGPKHYATPISLVGNWKNVRIIPRAHMIC